MTDVTSSEMRIGGFELVTRIATSVETELWLATDEEEVVVVKRPGSAASPAASARIRVEGAAIEALTHPGIVRLLSRGESEGAPYLVLEYLAGEDSLSLLRQAQTRGRCIPPAIAARIVADAAAGVNELHEKKGLIHGDLAPANLFTEYWGRSLVLDFGASRLAGSLASKVAGRAAYLAPEVLLGSPATACADVFALGATLFELISGSKLVESLATRSPRAKSRGSRPSLRAPAFQQKKIDTRIRKIKSAVGVELAQVIAGAVRLVPGDRFASASELARALEPWAAATHTLAKWIEGIVPTERRAARCDPLSSRGE
jgi:serine/threonine protein kinase